MPRKRSLGAVGKPGVGAFLLEGLHDAVVDGLVLQHIAVLVGEDAIGTPQARWRDSTQSGRSSIMARRRGLARRRHEAGGVDRGKSARAQRVTVSAVAVVPSAVLVHVDEPLRRVAEDHRLLRPPGMRILVLQPSARKQRVVLDQLVDDGLVGVALLAVVVDDARRSARRGPDRSPARPW